MNVEKTIEFLLEHAAQQTVKLDRIVETQRGHQELVGHLIGLMSRQESAQRRTERRLNALAERTDRRFRETDRRIQEMSERTDKRFQETDKAFKELARAQRRTEKALQELTSTVNNWIRRDGRRR